MCAAPANIGWGSFILILFCASTGTAQMVGETYQRNITVSGTFFRDLAWVSLPCYLRCGEALLISLCTASLSHSTNIPPLVSVLPSHCVALKLCLSSYLALTLRRSHTHQRYTAALTGRALVHLAHMNIDCPYGK